MKTIYKFNIIIIFQCLFVLQVNTQSKILFARSNGAINTGGTLDLMMYDPLSKETKLLLKGTVNRRGEYNPVTSPDNSKIIFNSYKFSGWKLAIADFDGSKVSKIRKFTNRPNYEYTAKYSPDGNKIVYQEYNWGNNSTTIYVADKNGKNPKQLIKPEIGDQNLDWTKDGKAIVFTYAKDNNLSIYMKPLDGKELRKISNQKANEFAPSTSKVENKIAFLSDKTGKIDLFVMNLDGSGLQNLTKNLKTVDEDANNIWAYKTSWSPDGKKIVFTAMIDGDLELFIVNSNGSELEQITNNSDTDITPFWTN